MSRAGAALAAMARLVAGLIACVAIAGAAYRSRPTRGTQVVDYRSPYVAAAACRAAEPARGGAARGRVVLVIVDGLRRTSRARCRRSSTLRQHGADLTLDARRSRRCRTRTGRPSSRARRSAISGVTTNWFEGRVPVETLLDTALARGRRVVVVGPERLRRRCTAPKRADGHYFRGLDEDELPLGHARRRRAASSSASANPGFVRPAPARRRRGGARLRRRVARVPARPRSGSTPTCRVLVNGLQDGEHDVRRRRRPRAHRRPAGTAAGSRRSSTVPAVFAGPGVGLGEGDAAGSRTSRRRSRCSRACPSPRARDRARSCRRCSSARRRRRSRAAREQRVGVRGALRCSRRGGPAPPKPARSGSSTDADARRG